MSKVNRALISVSNKEGIFELGKELDALGVEILSTGGTAKKLKDGQGFTKYEKPTRILKIWMANNKNAEKKSIAAKYAEYAHISKKRALREFFLFALTINDAVIRKLDLTEQEKDFLIEYKGALKVAHGLNKFALKN